MDNGRNYECCFCKVSVIEIIFACLLNFLDILVLMNRAQIIYLGSSLVLFVVSDSADIG